MCYWKLKERPSLYSVSKAGAIVFCSYVEAKKVKNEPGYVPMKCSKDNVESSAWFLFAANNKMWDERKKLGEEISNTNRTQLNNF